MDAFDSRLASVAKTNIEELVVNRTQAVVNGNARTFEKHREDIGYLQGLKDSLSALDDAKRLMNAGERA